MDVPNVDVNDDDGMTVYPVHVIIPSKPCNTPHVNARITDKLVNSPWRFKNRFGVELTENDVIRNLEKVRLQFVFERKNALVNHQYIVGAKEVLVFGELTAKEKIFEVPEGLVFTPRSLQEWVMDRYDEDRFILRDEGIKLDAHQLLYGLYNVRIDIDLLFVVEAMICPVELRNLLRHTKYCC